MHRVFGATAVNARKTLASLDIGEAFLKGWEFDSLETTTNERRRAFFDLPCAEDYQYLFELDPVFYGLLLQEYLEELLLEALKGGFGFKDAPRAWGSGCTEHS